MLIETPACMQGVYLFLRQIYRKLKFPQIEITEQ